MKKRLLEASCEYVEHAVAHARQWGVLQAAVWMGLAILRRKKQRQHDAKYRKWLEFGWVLDKI
jgi:hypothetical protein